MPRANPGTRGLDLILLHPFKEQLDNTGTVCGFETMNHTIISLFSILHFPVTLLFPEAAETAKRQLVFE